MQWLNEPAQWSEQRGSLVVTVGAATDFWRITGYGYVRDNGHLYAEQVTGDFSRADYLRLQSLVYDVSEALRQVLEVERVYILSLGSQQANRHVHWHVAPLPPGVPLEQQQFAALDLERAGVLVMSEAEKANLAERISVALRGLRLTPGPAGR